MHVAFTCISTRRVAQWSISSFIDMHYRTTEMHSRRADIIMALSKEKQQTSSKCSTERTRKVPSKLLDYDTGNFKFMTSTPKEKSSRRYSRKLFDENIPKFNVSILCNEFLCEHNSLLKFSNNCLMTCIEIYMVLKVFTLLLQMQNFHLTSNRWHNYSLLL